MEIINSYCITFQSIYNSRAQTLVKRYKVYKALVFLVQDLQLRSVISIVHMVQFARNTFSVY